MKNLGGYHMVSLGDIPLTETSITFSDIYAKLFNNLGKPVMLCDINIKGTLYKDCYVQPVFTEAGIIMTVGDYTITVTSDNSVSATAGIVGGGGSDIPDLNPSQNGYVLTNVRGEMGWAANHDVPSGGQRNEVLTKTGDATYEVGWSRNTTSSSADITLTASDYVLPNIGSYINVTERTKLSRGFLFGYQDLMKTISTEYGVPGVVAILQHLTFTDANGVKLSSLPSRFANTYSSSRITVSDCTLLGYDDTNIGSLYMIAINSIKFNTSGAITNDNPDIKITRIA